MLNSNFVTSLFLLNVRRKGCLMQPVGGKVCPPLSTVMTVLLAIMTDISINSCTFDKIVYFNVYLSCLFKTCHFSSILQEHWFMLCVACCGL